MAKTPKMTHCKYCGAEIAANAKACPACGGKNKKPIYKRVWFWILIVILLLIIASGAGGKKGKKTGEVSSTGTSTEESSVQETSEAAEPDSEGEEAADEAVLKDVYHVGDILEDGDVRIVYAASGVYPGGEYSQPEEGYQYIFLKLGFENMSETKDHSVSFYNFEAYADGYSAEMYYAGNDDLSATLSAGKKAVGYLYFTVPVDAQEIEIEYTSDFWTDEKIKFAYDGEKDSGYEPEKDTEASPDAHTVGETVELSDLNITYVSCEEYASDNMFVAPADGCHFMKCVFEFENTGSSDITVTSFDFDAYADGITCVQIFIADDDLSATLSAGRKAKGSVVFEVPNDAVTVEAEYLSNIWTSERIVFTIK